MSVTSCARRAVKYASKIAASVNLNSDEEAGLRQAYEKDCANWDKGYTDGMRAYAKTGGR